MPENQWSGNNTKNSDFPGFQIFDPYPCLVHTTQFMNAPPNRMGFFRDGFPLLQKYNTTSQRAAASAEISAQLKRFSGQVTKCNTVQYSRQGMRLQYSSIYEFYNMLNLTRGNNYVYMYVGLKILAWNFNKGIF